MTFLVLIMLFKLFFFFRINKDFSIVTTMILSCLFDLRIFMSVFFVMLTFFGACFNVLGKNPQVEMKSLNPFLRNVINCLRIAFGDNEYD